MRTFITLLAILILPVMGFSATHYVPDDYVTIQEAIDAVGNGDIIVVKPGTYFENIDFKGKAITVKSEQGSNVTIIDGNQSGSVVRFHNNEGLDSILEGFIIKNGKSDTGGGIKCSGSSPTILGNIISGNLASESVFKSGGGISCFSFSCPAITNNTISNNTATGDGGGIYCYYDCSPEITNNDISHNVTTGGGGGICCFSYSNPLITDNTISGNTAGFGGGIYCWSLCYPKIKNNTISGNIASDTGGGIMCWSSCHPTIENNNISGNSAGEWGGGIEIVDNCSPTITNNSITGNWADSYGGGGIVIYSYCAGTITDNIISGNFANLYGGGIQCYDHVSPVISNNIIAENAAEWSGGIECYDNAFPIITNNTLYGNMAMNGNGGGIVCRHDSFITISNTILWNNEAFYYGPEIYIDSDSNPSTVDISYSDVKGGQSSCYVDTNCTLNWGAGMIDADPLFVDPANNDFHLTYNSPCRDTGDNTAVSELRDFEGDPRIAWGGTVDMGADEFYTHLYITGDQTPGGSIQGKLVGLPGTSPVFAIIGFEVYDPPKSTIYGDLYLKPPRILIPLFPMPGNGIITIPTAVPPTPPAPYDIPMQGLVGLNSDSLTNLCVLEVR